MKLRRLLDVIFCVIGVIILALAAKEASAYEDNTLEKIQGLYKYQGFFQDTILVYPDADVEGGLDMMNVHGTVVKIIVTEDCLQIILDVPAEQPYFWPCIPNILETNQRDYLLELIKQQEGYENEDQNV